MTQYARPSGVNAVSSWYESVGSSQTNIYTAIDETTRSDTDYIYSTPDGVPDTAPCEIALSSINDPNVHTGHIVRYTYLRTKTNKDLTLVVRLVDSSYGVIASWTHANPSDVYALAEQTLSEAQAGNITSYSDLALQFEVTVNAGGGGHARVSWAELQTPDGPQILSPSSIGSAESFNSPTVGVGSVSIAPSSVSSLEAFLQPQLNLFLTISAIDSQEAFGTHDVSQGLNLFPSSIESEEIFGSVIIEAEAVNLEISSIASLESFNDPIISFLNFMHVESNKGIVFVSGINSYGRAISKLLSRENIDFKCDFQFDNTNQLAYFKIFLRTSNDWYDWKSPTTGYELSICNTGNWEINYLSSGSSTQIVERTWSSNTSENKLHFVIYGSTLAVSVWLGVDLEPSWEEMVTDNNISSAGSIQLGYFVTEGSHLIYIDNIIIKGSSSPGLNIRPISISSAQAFGPITLTGGEQVENIFGPLVQVI